MCDTRVSRDDGEVVAKFVKIGKDYWNVDTLSFLGLQVSEKSGSYLTFRTKGGGTTIRQRGGYKDLDEMNIIFGRS